jgi:hypothetical protein
MNVQFCRMKSLLRPWLSLSAIAISFANLLPAQTVIQSLSPSGALVWSNDTAGSISVIERTADLSAAPWEAVYFDWGTSGLKTNQLTLPSASAGFYRVNVLTNPPDTNLILHLSFDNDFPAGTVLDVSGHGNHGLRYGRPGYPTNWPKLFPGPDGSQAARFQSYYDGYGLYGRSGDYIAIPITPELASLPKATIALWAYYFTSLDNIIQNDHTSTLMNSGKDFAGTFFFGREYANYTSFVVMTSPTTAVEPITFPDVSPVGNSGGWHHYVVTFESGVVKGYFDGRLIGSGSAPVAALTAAGRYIGMSCWTFNVTPELDLSVDGHPNNAWINGAVDDVRIYRRALNLAEIESLYRSFDKMPPTAPTGLVVEAVASSVVSLRWKPATDLFGVSGYEILRDGQRIAETTNTSYFDTNLSAGTLYRYAIHARDVRGMLSTPANANISTRPVDGGVDLVVDDGDGGPWINPVGTWGVAYATNSVITQAYLTSFVSDDRVGKGQKTYSFGPPLAEAGSYDVYFWHPGKSDATHLFSTTVPVDIISGSTTNTVFVNQRTGQGQWKLLGRYPLEPGASVRVRTDGTSTSHYILADAVRFVK